MVRPEVVLLAVQAQSIAVKLLVRKLAILNDFSDFFRGQAK
jgi:hypothetical protein